MTTATRFRLDPNALPDGHEDEFKLYKFLRTGPKHVASAPNGNQRLNGVPITEVQTNTLRKVMGCGGFTDVGAALRYLLDHVFFEEDGVNFRVDIPQVVQGDAAAEDGADSE